MGDERTRTLASLRPAPAAQRQVAEAPRPDVLPAGSTEALTRLQSAVGNDGMAEVAGGTAPAAIMERAGVAAPPDGGAPGGDAGGPAEIPDAGAPAGAPPPAGPPPPPAPDGGPRVPEGPPGAARATTPAPPAPAGPPAPPAGPPRPAGAGGPPGTAPPGTAPPGTAPPGTAAPHGGARPGPQQGPAAGGPAPQAEPPTESGAEALPSGGLSLVSEELAEHEAWGRATRAVGAAGSEDRADFIAREVGEGVGSGFGTGFAMGIITTIGIQAAEGLIEEVAGTAVPGVGQVIGGVLAAKALWDGWDRNMAAIGQMGEGRSGYEEAANDIQGVCAILDVVSQVVNILAGIVGIVAVAAAAAALLTLGALSPLAVAAGEIAVALGAVGMIIGLVKSALQPLVLLFRALHTFTSTADPRAIEAQGHGLSEAGGELGGALGGLVATVAAPGPEGERPPGEEHGTPPVEPQVEPVPPPVVEAEPISVGAAGGEPAGTPPATRPAGEPALELDTSGQPIGGPALEPHEVALPPGEGPPLELDTGGGPPPRRATSDNMYEIDANALEGNRGPLGKGDPNRIMFDENMRTSGVTSVTVAEHADVMGARTAMEQAGGPPALGGIPETGSMIPEGVGTEIAVPTDPVTGEPIYDMAVRTHGPNPNAPAGTFSSGNTSTQVNFERIPAEPGVAPAGPQVVPATSTLDPVAGQFGPRTAADAHMPAGDNYPAPAGPAPAPPPDYAYSATRTDSGPAGADVPVTLRDGIAYDAAGNIPEGGMVQQEYGPPGARLPADFDPEEAVSVFDPELRPYQPPEGGGGAPPPGGGTPPAPQAPEPAPPAPARHPEQDLPSVIVNEEALGLEPGSTAAQEAPPGAARPPERTSDVDWDDPQVRRAFGLDPVTGKPTSATLSGPGQLEVDPTQPGYTGAETQGPFRGEEGQMVTDPVTGEREFKPEAVLDISPRDRYVVRVEQAGARGPGAWYEQAFDTQAEAEAYAAQVAARGVEATRDASALPRDWAPSTPGGPTSPGNAVEVVNIYKVPAGTPGIRSTAGPMPEGAQMTPGGPPPQVRPGGGPQIQYPRPFARPGETPMAPGERPVVPLDPRPDGSTFQPVPVRGGRLDPAAGGGTPGGSPPPPPAPAPAPAVPPAPSAAPAGNEVAGPVIFPTPAGPQPAHTGPDGGAAGQFAHWAETSPSAQFGERLHRNIEAGEIARGEQERAGGGGEGGGAGGEHAPLVEPVNPAYQPPPGTPEQLEAMKRDIARLLSARSRAQRSQQQMGRVTATVTERGQQLQEIRQGTDRTTAAAQTHETETTNRQTANQQQQEHHDQSGGQVEDAASQLAGVATLETLLSGWSSFTSVASLLPGAAGRKFHEMNEEAVRFMTSLAHIRTGVRDQQAQQPGRGAEIAANRQRIQTVQQQTPQTRADLARATESGTQIAAANDRKLAATRALGSRDAQAAASSGDQAARRQQEHDTLAAQLQAWASEHRAARQLAVEETTRRLEAAGYRVTRRPER